MLISNFILQAMMGLPFFLVIGGAILFFGSLAVIKLYRLILYLYNKSKNMPVKGEMFFMQDVIVSFLISFALCAFFLYRVFNDEHSIN